VAQSGRPAWAGQPRPVALLLQSQTLQVGDELLVVVQIDLPAGESSSVAVAMP
jgi:hypothetical protein